MGLVSEIKYKTRIKNLRDLSPKSVLTMLKDIRSNIGKLDGSFVDVDLARVLKVVETGKYEINGSVLTCIDLSSAEDVIDTYREYSEGGCRSCVNLGRETIDAQDATSGWYCRVSDPDYDKNVIGDRPGIRYEGFSPKVTKHYKKPCESWKPKFSPKLEELIAKNRMS